MQSEKHPPLPAASKGFKYPRPYRVEELSFKVDWVAISVDPRWGNIQTLFQFSWVVAFNSVAKST